MWKTVVAALLLFAPAIGAESMTAPQLIELAGSNRAGLADAINASFKAEDLKNGTAYASRGKDFFFATQAAAEPRLVIDDASGPQMKQVAGTGLWYAVAVVGSVGRLHAFHYVVDGATFGGSSDVPAYTPLAYAQDGVPAGKLSEKIVHTSRIYDGMKSDYWIYVPAQYDAKVPAALMVFQDGHAYTDRQGNEASILNVIDNLIAQHKIPVMICVFINPGSIGGSPGTPTYAFVQAYARKWDRTLDDSMRSTLYDTVSDRYARFLRDEVLAGVAARYNLRKDAYSRGITGLSSGGICSFNAAWQMPDQFSRVLTWIGSFTSIQWHEDPANPDGGQDYPEKVLREPARNLRVWLQDGSGDMEIRYGSWPMANIRMANALKLKEYDFHFSFGKGTHNASHGKAEFPESMIWLWRDYDPSRTSQHYEMEPAEKALPAFRIAIVNR
jgi:enterochelin esterase-like enzyme